MHISWSISSINCHSELPISAKPFDSSRSGEQWPNTFVICPVGDQVPFSREPHIWEFAAVHDHPVGMTRVEDWKQVEFERKKKEEEQVTPVTPTWTYSRDPLLLVGWRWHLIKWECPARLRQNGNLWQNKNLFHIFFCYSRFCHCKGLQQEKKAWERSFLQVDVCVQDQGIWISSWISTEMYICNNDTNQTNHDGQRLLSLLFFW